LIFRALVSIGRLYGEADPSRWGAFTASSTTILVACEKLLRKKSGFTMGSEVLVAAADFLL
jgi:hypothetical protein